VTGKLDRGVVLGTRELDAEESKQLDEIYFHYNKNLESQSKTVALSIYLAQIEKWLLNMIEKASKKAFDQVSQDKINVIKEIVESNVMIDIMLHYIFLVSFPTDKPLPFDIEKSKIVMKHSAWAIDRAFNMLQTSTIDQLKQKLKNIKVRYNEVEEKYNKLVLPKIVIEKGLSDPNGTYSTKIAKLRPLSIDPTLTLKESLD